MALDAVSPVMGRDILCSEWNIELELEEGLAGSDEGNQLFERDTPRGVLRSEKKEEVEAFRKGRYTVLVSNGELGLSGSGTTAGSKSVSVSPLAVEDRLRRPNKELPDAADSSSRKSCQPAKVTGEPYLASLINPTPSSSCDRLVEGR